VTLKLEKYINIKMSISAVINVTLKLEAVDKNIKMSISAVINVTLKLEAVDKNIKMSISAVKM